MGSECASWFSVPPHAHRIAKSELVTTIKNTVEHSRAQDTSPDFPVDALGVDGVFVEVGWLVESPIGVEVGRFVAGVICVEAGELEPGLLASPDEAAGAGVVIDGVVAVEVEGTTPTTLGGAVTLHVWQYDVAMFVASATPLGSFMHETAAHDVMAATAWLRWFSGQMQSTLSQFQ